jgi:transcriptional regulator NrdR family protein
MSKVKRVRGGASIPCPRCKGPTRVLQTRRQPDLTVRRERTCLRCKVTFDTHELRPDREIRRAAA